METVRKIYTDLRSYNENFMFRERHFDRSSAVKIMLYPRFMVVNKTNYTIECQDQKIPACSCDFLLCEGMGPGDGTAEAAKRKKKKKHDPEYLIQVH